MRWPRGVTLVGGFGVVPVGAALGIIPSGDRQGKYAPYNPNPNDTGGDPVTWTGARAYLVTDSGTGQTLYVKMEDSYKFAVDDPVILNSDGGDPYALTVSAIDRTTYLHMAAITVTGTISVSHTVALGAHLAIKTDASTPFQKCAGILEGAVDTGEGVNAKGGLGVMVISNAVLRKGFLQNVDSDAVTDLGNNTSVVGQYLIMK